MKFIFIFIFFLQFFNLNAKNIDDLNSASKNERDVLKGIRGNAGHIGNELFLDIETLSYKYLRKQHYIDYLGKSSVSHLKLKGSITYFLTDFNRYSFLLEVNLNVGFSDFSYQSFSFGVVDSLYFNDEFSLDLGVTTTFEGDYKFFITTGVSYYFIRKKNYYIAVSDYFSFLINAINLNNNLSLKWMYIF